MTGRNEAYFKVLNTIKSCNLVQQLEVAYKFIKNYYKLYEDLSTYETLMFEYNNKVKELEV